MVHKYDYSELFCWPTCNCWGPHLALIGPDWMLTSDGYQEHVLVKDATPRILKYVLGCASPLSNWLLTMVKGTMTNLIRLFTMVMSQSWPQLHGTKIVRWILEIVLGLGDHENSSQYLEQMQGLIWQTNKLRMLPYVSAWCINRFICIIEKYKFQFINIYL